MNTPKICIPVMGDSVEELVNKLKQSQKQSNCLEIRADSINDFHVSDVATLKKAATDDTIFTYRSSAEGGNNPLKEAARIQILQEALDLDFPYVDVELSTIESRNLRKNPHSKLILSYHNFLETPTYWDLSKKIDEMRSYQADIMKIATMVLADKDVITLTRVLVNKLPKDEMIVLGMGDKGKITRLLQPLLGGYLTYASAESGASAPGQLDIKVLTKLLENISSVT